MTLEAVTFILFAPFFIFVNSQQLEELECDGWFGPRCEYKCHCADGLCFSDGQCNGSQCEDGWFGPACQYADMAFKTTTNEILVDGNENTCLTGNTTQVRIQLNESLPFTWLRAIVNNQGSVCLKVLSVSFSNNGSLVDCVSTKKQYVDQATLDIHCYLTGYIDIVTLDGEAAGHLCSVYISGGRNVALKENATQDRTYHGVVGGKNVTSTADKAVDGNRKRRLSCATAHGVTGLVPAWSVILSKPRSVNRYVIYNRDSLQYRLLGFKIEVFETPKLPLFAIVDSRTQPMDTYTVKQNLTTVQKVAVSVNNSDNILTLCEVEVYGDSVCDAHHYGRECEFECFCPNDQACFVATGGCPSLCPAGFQGPNCSKECGPGTFGEDCIETCSESCESTESAALSPCDRIHGACVLGCKSGFIGVNCEKKCDAGLYGENCSSSCSPMCVAPVDANVSACAQETGSCIYGCISGYGKTCSQPCNPKCVAHKPLNISKCAQETGACINGCENGYNGDFCENMVTTTTEKVMDIGVQVIIVVGSVMSGVVFLSYCLFAPVSRQPREERSSFALQDYPNAN